MERSLLRLKFWECSSNWYGGRSVESMLQSYEGSIPSTPTITNK